MNRIIIIVVVFMISNLSWSQELSKVLHPEQMKEDSVILQEALTQLHPGLNKFNTKKEIDILFEDLNKMIKKPLNEKDFYLLLAKLTEKIACGHTYLNPWNLDQKAISSYMPKNVIPFCYKVIDKKFIITHNLTEDKKITRGTEITKINGISIQQIIDSLLQVSRSDGKNAIEKKLNNLAITPELTNSYNLSDIFIPLFLKNTIKEFECKTIDNKIFKTTQSDFTLAKRERIFIKKYGKIPTAENLLTIKMITPETCYFDVGTFSIYGEKNVLFKKIDSLFLALKNDTTIKNLIIDIRKTEGGNTAARDYLLQYILPKDFVSKEYDEKVFHAFLEVPKRLIPFLYTWNENYLKPKSNDVFTKNEIGLYQNLTSIPDGSENISDFKVNNNRFRGKIILMTSPVNSSVAFEVARIFQTYKAGEIVGEKTGGTKKGINGCRSFFLTLPNSKIEVDIPILYQAHLNQPDEGIIPDYLVKETQQDVFENRDSQLEFAVKILK